MIKQAHARHHNDRPESIMLGEEAGSNKINLFYANMCHQLEKQKTQDSLKVSRNVSTAKTGLRGSKTEFIVLQKSAAPKPDLKLTAVTRPNSVKNVDVGLPRSASRKPSSKNPLLIAPPSVRPKKNTSIRYSAREKLVIDWYIYSII